MFRDGSGGPQPDVAALPAAPGPRGGGGQEEEEAVMERVQQESVRQ